MKWIGRILFAFVVFQVGMIVVQQATLKKHTTYYIEKGVPLLEENKKDEYIQQYFTATSVKDYITDPIYEGSSQDEEFPLNFSIHNARQDGKNQSVIFYFDDRNEETGKPIDYKALGLVKNEKNFDENPTLVYIRILLYMDEETEPLMYYFPLTLPKADDNGNFTNNRMPVELLRITEDGRFQYTVLNDKRKQEARYADRISKMELIIQDYSEEMGKNEGNTPNQEKTIATFIHSDDAKLGSKEVLTRQTDDKGNELINKSLNFNGEVKNYDLKEKYKNKEFVTYPDVALVNEYSNVMIKPILTFALIATAATYLIFFLKPTMAFFENRRDAKARALRDAREALKKENEANAIDTAENEIEVVEEEVIDEVEELEETIESVEETEQVVDQVEEIEEVTEVVEKPAKKVSEVETTKAVDLNTFTVAELKSIAKEMNLTGYSTLRKAEVIELIKKNM